MLRNIVTPFIGDDGRYHYLYKTTNHLIEKIYIGVHSFSKPFDEKYYGSNHQLIYDINEIGKSWFTCLPIKYFKNRTELLNAEIKLVDNSFINRNDTYNRMTGGGTGVWSQEARMRVSGQNHNRYGVKHSDDFKQYLSRKFQGRGNPFYGKSHSNETIEKVRQSNTGRPPPNKGIPMSQEQKEKLGKKILAISKTGDTIVFNTIKEAKVKLRAKNIHKVLNGERNHSGGYRFKYL